MKLFATALITISAAMAITAGTLAQSTREAREADVHELERLENVWNRAHEQGDVAALEALWADDLEIAVPHRPVLSRFDVSTFAHSGQLKFLRYQSSDLRVRVYDNSAVVTGRLQRTRIVNDAQVSDDWRFTKVYIRNDGKWQVVSFHASEAAPQPSAN